MLDQLVLSLVLAGRVPCPEAWAASSLDALQLAPHMIKFHVGCSPASNSLLHYKRAAMIEPIDKAFYADVLHQAWHSWVGWLVVYSTVLVEKANRL